MSATKIQDEQEVIRWFEEGRTYAEMVDLYRDKYNIETVPSLWGNFRRRKGLPRRIARNDELIPWEVRREHRWDYPIMMLRYEARRREGFELTDESRELVDGWLRGMERDGTVLHYEPDTEQGWFYVERRPGIDKDIIREPARKTTARKRAD